ncbi:MAG: GNAT family N-acetyltransferase [Thermoplasmata archaeon]|nr:GNAT family N-acetyltransferase [Thermoplasmata archaeon]
MWLPELTLISHVVTHPDARGRGHARRATGWLTREAIGRGAFAALYVRDSNLPARAVYDRLGFELLAHRTWVETDAPATA